MVTKCILLFLVIVLCVNFGQSMRCIMNTLTNDCECPAKYKNNNGTCEAECTYPCGKGTCFKPNQCKCFDGYKIDIKRLLIQTADKLPVCVPSCKHCTGECVAPNTCIVTTTVAPSTTTPLITTLIPTTTSTIVTPTVITTPTTTPGTTVAPKLMTTAAVPTITSTVTPAIVSTTGKTPAATTVVTTTMRTTTLAPEPTAHSTTIASTTNTIRTIIPTIATTLIPDISTTEVINTFESSTEAEKEIITHEMVAHSLDPSLLERKTTEESLMAQNCMIAVVSLIIATIIILLLVWRWKHIIRFFKGRSYVVEDDRTGINGVQYSRTANDETYDAYC